MSDSQAEPKIVVDEDWKSRVQAEKEAAARSAAGTASAEPAKEPAAESAAGSPAADQPPPKEAADAAAEPLPTASFDLLISTLAAQALTAMGKLPDPVQGHAVVRPDLAQHYIDMLGMLEKKTKGNLTRDEAAMLDDVLHHLRMTFVTTRREPAPDKGPA